jgi:hypothetical protein
MIRRAVEEIFDKRVVALYDELRRCAANQSGDSRPNVDF